MFFIPAPIHFAPHRRKIIVDKGIEQTPLSHMPDMFFKRHRSHNLSGTIVYFWIEVVC